MIKKEYIDSVFLKFFDNDQSENLFEVLWNRNDKWFEEPNIGRRDSKKAWSGVARIQLHNEIFFLKKQENYFFYSFKPPFRQLIVQKEYSNIKMFKSFGIPCLDVVYFGIRKEYSGISSKTQGIIITKALDNYMPLNQVMDKYWNIQEKEQQEIKKNVIDEIAVLIQKMHKADLMHHCLYPKHIYVDKEFCKTGKKNRKTPVCRLIDLESAREVPFNSRKQLRDLETLDRRTPTIDKEDKKYFLLKYLNKIISDQESKQLSQRIKNISR